MEVIRVEKRSNYTVISNEPLHDKNISNQARGLLAQILSLPPTWELTMTGLTTISRDGIDAIRSQINELEKAGYITHERERDERGRMKKNIYTVYECIEQNPYYNPKTKRIELPSKKANINSKNKKKENSKKNLKSQKSDYTNGNNESTNSDNSGYTNRNTGAKNGLNTDFSPTLDFPILDKPTLGDPTLGNPTLENPTQINNKEKNNKELINNLSIYQIDGIDFDDKSVDDVVADNIGYREIMEQIDYKEKNPDVGIAVSFSREFFKMVYTLICDTLKSQSSQIRVGGTLYPAGQVKERLLMIDENMIGYVDECIKEQSSKGKHIKNYRAYLLTALYNAPVTMDAHIEQQIESDFYG